MRGKQKFKALAGKSSVASPKKSISIKQKDEKIALMAARYVYYSTYGDTNGKMVMEEVLTRLSKEFFLSTNRIANILTDNAHLIDNLRRKAPDKKWFRQEWSYWVW